MCKIIPFKVDHIDCMDVRDHEKRFNVEGLKALEGKVSFTGIIDGRIISCGGLVMYSETGAELWQIPSIYVKQYAGQYARHIKKWLAEISADLGLKRMETISLDDPLHNRWMTFLGFEKEGVKKQFLNGADYAVWGKLWV